MKIFYLFFALFLQLSFSSFSQDMITAKNLSQSQRFEDAAGIYKELINKEPANGDVYFYYGENILSEYLNDPYSNSKNNAAKEASDQFKQGIKKDSLNPLNYIGLAMVAVFEKKDTSLANTYYAKAEKTLPKKIKNYTPKNIETLIKLSTAELCADKPRFAKAIAWGKKATLISETNPEVFIAMGDIYISKSDPSSAMKNYNRALYLDPNNVLLLTKIGNIYIRAKNLNQSRDYFEKAKAIDSTFAPLYKGLGEAYSMVGRHDFAKLNYKKFLDLSGNNIPAKVSYINSLFKARDYKETLNQIEEVQKIDNSRNYLNRLGAYSAFEMKPANYDLALKYIEKFFENTTPDKTITRDYAYHGRILLKLKKNDEQVNKGIDMLKTAYQNDTTDMEMLDELATTAYYNKNFTLAVEALEKKIELGQANTNDYMYLGKTYYQMGEFNKADEVFTMITKKEPDYIQAYVWIANTYASMDPESKEGLAEPKYETVIQKALTDTVKNKGELYDAYSYMGSYYLFSPKADFDKSEIYCQKIINLDPKNKKMLIKSYKTMGIIYTKKKDYPRAVTFYKKALALDPSDTDTSKTIEGLNKTIAAQKEAAANQ